MADLIAIGYDDTTTAMQAEEEVQRLAQDLVIQPDAVAVIIRSQDGKIKTITNHHAVGKGATWGLFWGFLFGLLFFIPFFGMAAGAGIGALIGHVSKAGVDQAFQNQVREMLKPGTSALFMVVEQMTTDKAMDALSKYGGTVLKTSLSKEAEKQLQDALHGEQGDRLTSDQPAESVQRSALN